MITRSPVQLCIFSISAFFFIYFVFLSSNSCGDESHSLFSRHKHALHQFTYFDMDRSIENENNKNKDISTISTTINMTNIPHVLILTPFKEAAQHIDRYFDNVNKLTYPHDHISLGFLVSDSKDGTIEKLQEKAKIMTQEQPSWQVFHRIDVFQKDFQYDLPSNEDRHAFSVQVKRRQIMAKSRNTLLSAALTQEIDWVLWLDGDVVEYPSSLLEELIGLNKDIVVPNCYWHSYNEEGGYDRNNWQETKESWDFQNTLKPSDVLVEGKTKNNQDIKIKKEIKIDYIMKKKLKFTNGIIRSRFL